MESSDRVLALYKFGKRDYIDQFVHEGHIYMNSLNYFRTLENDILRKDKQENASYCKQADGGSLQMKQNGEFVEVAKLRGPVIFSNDNNDYRKVFCMYAFRESASKSLVDPRNFAFGDSYAILIDGDEFISRVHATAKKANIALDYGIIEYVDRTTYAGTMGVFRKFTDFAYQSEFRLSVFIEMDTPFSLRIGDISDISMIGPLADLNKRIKISPK